MNEIVRHGVEPAAPVHYTDGIALRARPISPQGAQGRRGGLPTSDLGTVLLHWLSAVAMVVSLATGLRISADALDSVFSRWISPLLPQGEIWSVHILAGLTLFGASTAYVAYIAMSGLSGRVALRRVRVFGLTSAPKLRWMSINVALHWILYALVLVLAVTGVLLYVGFGGLVVRIHVVAAMGALAYVLVHVVAHLGYGGWRQLLRIFRPATLVPNPGRRSRRPLLLASVVALPAAVGVVGLDLASRDTLVVRTTGTPPTLDGTLDDAAWQDARVVRVRTQQGANLGGSGESTVEIRAVREGSRIHFAFQWEDPTRSLARLPMVKRADGWHVNATRAGDADVVDFYEDKFSVILSHSNAFGGGGATHMGPKPLAGKPSALNERGLHYTTDGSVIDMWQWKASRGGLLGYVDDQYIGPPREPSAAEAMKRARYQGGYWSDPGRAFYTYNFGFEGPGGYAGPVKPKRLPTNPAATMKALGPFDLTDPDRAHDEGTLWWMMEADTVPYSEAADALIPVGTMMPGVLIAGDYEGDRADVRGGARWKGGVWTLEVSRELRTGSPYDVAIVPGGALYLWVAVFDHNQTRHTRHARPIAVELH